MKRSALLILLSAMLLGCTYAIADPPAEPVPLTPRMVAVVIEDHLGDGFAAYAARPDTLGATVYYPAAPGRAAWGVTAALEAAGSSQVVDCDSTETEAPQPNCIESDQVRLAWYSGHNQFQIVSTRAARVAIVTVEVGEALDGRSDPRTLTLPVPLAKLVDLAKDWRIDTPTDPELTRPAAANPRWTDDPDCAGSFAAPTGRQDLPPIGTPTEAITPQAVAAVVLAHVGGQCASVIFPGPADGVAATVYVTAITERVTVALIRGENTVTCSGWDACTDRDGTMVAYQFDVPEEYPARVRLSRAIKGGYLVVTEASHHADPSTRAFPVPLSRLRDVLTDPRLGFLVDPALNRAGNSLPIAWRLTPATNE